MLDDIIKHLDLSPRQSKIYKLILEYGKIAPAHIARLSGINRTTIYGIASELEKKKLIIEDPEGRIVYYSPSGPEHIDRAISTAAAEFREKEHTLKSLREALSLLPKSKHYSIPKIKFIDERDIESYLHEAFARWVKTMRSGEKTWWGFQDSSFSEKYEDWIDWFWKRVPRNIDLKMFTNNTAIEDSMKQKPHSQRRIMRFWDTAQFTSTQWIAGDYIIFLMTQQRPYYLIEIHDAVMAHNMRLVFKQLWNNSDSNADNKLE